MDSLEPGDLVRHRSGGPVMRVARGESNDGKVRCVWYAEGKAGSQFFARSDLIRVTTPVENTAR